MESTRVYWKPLYNLFELMDLNAIVVNASHMKALLGRKTDIKEAEWIADLLRHGLLRASFIPGQEQRGQRLFAQGHYVNNGYKNGARTRFLKILLHIISRFSTFNHSR